MSQPPQLAEAALFERVYLARDDGAGNAGEPAAEFARDDIPIHCVVILSNANEVTVRMALIAVNVPGVKPGTEIISTSYRTRDMQDRVFFKGRPHRSWAVGSYRADIFIDGNLVGGYPFLIKGPGTAAKPASRKAAPSPRATTAKRN
jgi:hypothetical protein